MKSLPERIMEHAEATPEATPICPAALLHLGQRAAVGQALSRLARSGRLMRIRQGVYMRPIESRFGRCAPGIEKSLLALSELWGETIVPNGGGAANWLGLTTQNPVRSVYLTSGRSRRLRFGKHPVELRHAPRWQLAAPHRMAGVVIRALAWLGPVRPSVGVQGRHLLVQGVARDPAVLGRHRHHLRHPRLRTGSGCRCRRRGAAAHAQSGEALDKGGGPRLEADTTGEP